MATSKQVSTGKKKKAPNPTGKGGFQERPQDRNSGHWKPENTISYQYRRFLSMTPKQLADWSKTPPEQRTVAMDLAYERIRASRKSLPDIREVTDRTEGKAPQAIDITSRGEQLAGATIVFAETPPQED